MKVPSRDTRLAPVPDVEFRTMDDGGIVLNVRTGACFRLNRVGADLWKELVDGRTVGEAIATLQPHYDVPPETLDDDSLRLCAEMIEAKLLRNAASTVEG